MKTCPDYKAHCYTVSIDREDYRASQRGAGNFLAKKYSRDKITQFF